MSRVQRRVCRSLPLWAAVLSLFWAPAAQAGNTLETFGDIGQFAIPAFAAAVSAFKHDGPGLVQLGVSSVLSFGTVEGLKYAVDKTGPDGSGQSFPSGHTARAFSGASYLHYRYGWQWGFPAYLAAGAVAYSRIDANKHDWVDVLAGAAISNAIAFVLVDAVDDNVIVMPIIGGKKNRFGILASIHF